MEDHEFFDEIYQQWSKTTGAADKFWMSELDEGPEEDEGYYSIVPGTWNIYAVDSEQNKTLVAVGLSEDDADFISGVHGCLADLVRRLHTAIDEAERYSCQRDDQEVAIAELALESDDLRQKLAQADDRLLFERSRNNDLLADLADIDQELMSAKLEVEHWRSEANSHNWRVDR